MIVPTAMFSRLRENLISLILLKFCTRTGTETTDPDVEMMFPMVIVSFGPSLRLADLVAVHLLTLSVTVTV